MWLASTRSWLTGLLSGGGGACFEHGEHGNRDQPALQAGLALQGCRGDIGDAGVARRLEQNHVGREGVVARTRTMSPTRSAVVCRIFSRRRTLKLSMAGSDVTGQAELDHDDQRGDSCERVNGGDIAAQKERQAIMRKKKFGTRRNCSNSAFSPVFSSLYLDVTMKLSQNESAAGSRARFMCDGRTAVCGAAGSDAAGREMSERKRSSTVAIGCDCIVWLVRERRTRKEFHSHLLFRWRACRYKTRTQC
jgi:hypothetical protein